MTGSTGWLVSGLVALLVVWVVRKAVKLWKFVSALEQLSGAPFSFPSGTIAAHPTDAAVVRYMLKYMRENPKGATRIWYGFLMPFVVLHRPHDIKNVITRHSPKAPTIYKFIRNWLGPKSVLLLEGEEWKTMRQLLDPAFHRVLLKNYSPTIAAAAEELCDKFERLAATPDNDTELSDIFSALTLDVICRCAFGYESGCQTNPKEKFSTAINEIDRLVAHRYLEPSHFFDFVYKRSKDGKKFQQLLDYVHEHATFLIERRRKELKGLTLEDITRDKRPSGRALFDFLDICLLSRDKDGNPALTDEEIRSQCDTFLFAGHDTTSAALSWLTFAFSRHPEYQEQCRQEVIDAFGDETPEYDGLANLEFLTACIREAMRMYPPVPGVARVLEEPLTLECGAELQPGTAVGIEAMAVHHNPTVWDDPETYNPYRFYQKRTDMYSFFPFSVGNRICIGNNFAMNEIRLVMCQLLRRFKFLPIEYEPALEASLILKSENGIRVNVQKLDE